MKHRTLLPAIVLLLATGSGLHAQDASPAVMAVYYECDQNLETALDAVIASEIAPIYEELIASGDLTGWGWAAHRIGGHWRRLEYYTAESRDALLDAREKVVATLQSEAAAAVNMWNAVCPRHEDYLFRVVSSGAGDGSVVGAFSVGTYFRCDQSREGRADEVFAEVLEPALNSSVANGTFASWSYLAHDRGGLVRRVLVVRGADTKSILNGFNQMTTGLSDAQRATLGEFTEVCSNHEDYVWAISGAQ